MKCTLVLERYVCDSQLFFSFILRYFEGYTPVLSVSDPDLLKDVLVKDFENFQSRKVLKNELKKRMIECEKNVINRIVSNCIFFSLCVQPFPLAPRKSLGLFLENGHQWKRSRTLLTPAFSAGKLKQMFGIMNECTDHLLESMNKKAKSCKTLDIYE